jgi:hypothetical protein
MDRKGNLGNSAESLRKRIVSSLWVDEECTSHHGRGALNWVGIVFISRWLAAPLPISSDRLYHLLQSLSVIGGQLNSLCNTICKSFVLAQPIYSKYKVNAFGPQSRKVYSDVYPLVLRFNLSHIVFWGTSLLG